ncbi:unnamed protein product [Adineta steineri]|uniref:Uncharacterized protein n=1 Tax=Adineta steineri TaxID=433720 RepID=A0A815H2R9_9BILA|nr:unnamed protein product [Adineta steineri]CAF3787494.1 unnamed protein product [Adineta steineri]
MISTEVSNGDHICTFRVDEDDGQALRALDSISFNDYNGLSASNNCMSWNSTYNIDPRVYIADKSEFDRYLPGFDSSKNDTINGNQYCASNNANPQLFKQSTFQNTQVQSKANPIPLSQSIRVAVPKKPKDPLHEIRIVNGLKKAYKARYKSDYFSQNGTVRDPRYLADQKGNHFVTLEVPTGIRGYLRVDWITIPDKNGIRYSMPYKFQVDHTSPDVSDRNPVYRRITPEDLGIIKLYLVLIKSKQEDLKKIQSMDIFPPSEHTLKTTDPNDFKEKYSLSPKQLIKDYQLDKSQLAFTFCSISPNGKQLIPEWDTTVYSTVLTEEMPVASKKRAVTCPNCEHSFEITLDNASDTDYEKPKRRKK